MNRLDTHLIHMASKHAGEAESHFHAHSDGMTPSFA